MDNTTTRNAPASGHETTDIHPAAPVLIAGGVSLITLIAIFAMFWLFQRLMLSSDERVKVSSPILKAVGEGDSLAPMAPPQDQLKSLREHESTVLSSRAWVDRERGVVRIPIEEAMEILGERESKPQEEKGSTR